MEPAAIEKDASRLDRLQGHAGGAWSRRARPPADVESENGQEKEIRKAIRDRQTKEAAGQTQDGR